MSIITFVNNIKEETGKSMSLVAIATYMAIEYNNKVLILSTTDKKDKIKSCFFEDKQVKKIRLGIFGENKSTLDTESGIEGIAKIVRSNRLTPDMITNYTKVVFKDRLEILLGAERKEKQNTEQMKINEEYINVIATANNYYDKIFVDLDENITEDVREKIINMSDLVIVNSSQNYKSLEKLKQNKETNELLNLPKTLFLIGRYDKYSKYNSKNITRYLEEKNQVLTIPYNTLFFEALNEAGVPDLFLKFKKLNDTEDRNAIFIQEIKRASENIVYRIQELQARM
ncbi:putative uncharacterized protein [Clostridium sp. CAG:575]|nr:putative uncharacterized protein [Clostridium sp. CAG:575]